MILSWIWFWAFEDWTLSLSWQMLLFVLLIRHREDTWHVSCPRTCLLSLKWSVLTRLANWRVLCSDYLQCTDVVNTRDAKAFFIWFIKHSLDDIETMLSMSPCFSHTPWLLIVREMVIGAPLPSIPNMEPSTSQGLFYCYGRHLQLHTLFPTQNVSGHCVTVGK